MVQEASPVYSADNNKALASACYQWKNWVRLMSFLLLRLSSFSNSGNGLKIAAPVYIKDALISRLPF